MSSGAWVTSHLFALIGFVLAAVGLLALWAVVSPTLAEPLSGAAVVTWWVGTGSTLPYFGGETFGLHAVAATSGGEGVALLHVVEGFRFHPVAISTFGLDLLALAGGGAVLAAVAMRRSGVLPRHAGELFARGFVLFLPQFFAPAAVRVGHGVLVAVGCGWVALALWRVARPAPGTPASPS